MKWTCRSISPGRPSCRQTPGTSASASTSWGTALEAPADGLGDLPLGVPLADRLPLVMRLAALGQRDLDLGVAVAEVQLQRHQCEARLLGLAQQPEDLLLVQQQ